jgi:aconitate hydratase
MVAAGLLARNAVARGLRPPPWVKTSLAPGSRAVTAYLDRLDLRGPLSQLGFDLVGYGCTTCIGNSGPLDASVVSAINESDLATVAVLSGNRNFEGRIHPLVRASYLASPPLVVAYALAGRIDVDLTTEPLGSDAQGRPVRLDELWPAADEVAAEVRTAVGPDLYRDAYADLFEGDAPWRELAGSGHERFAWDPGSTYVARAPFALPPFSSASGEDASRVRDLEGARVLAYLGDSVTTDHISPAGSIAPTSPAGRWLTERGAAPLDFNSYGSRRGHHEVMARGTFANVRLRNRLAGGAEGPVTKHQPSGTLLPIYDAAVRYAAEGVPLIILAGREYGTGSSRDWAAKGPRLLGVRAIVAESFERIHRSNLVGMGILPLRFRPGQTAERLGLTGRETYSIEGIAAALGSDGFVQVRAEEPGRVVTFSAEALVSGPSEQAVFRAGGILPAILARLAGAADASGSHSDTEPTAARPAASSTSGLAPSTSR